MNLQLDRPLVVFDIEATGLDLSRDRIVELSLLKVSPDGSRDCRTRRFNPEMHIPEESTAIHGITDEDVADLPPFSAYARSIAEMIKGCYMAGFNSYRFDLPLLGEEMLRAGVDIDLASMDHIDVQTIFHKMERRTLEAAVQFYCGREHVGAHGAEADTVATLDVLLAQLDRYGEALPRQAAELAAFTTDHRNVDLAGRIVIDEQGRRVINFGKYRGKPVEEVLRTDAGYLSWILQADFTRDTKRQFLLISEELKGR